MIGHESALHSLCLRLHLYKFAVRHYVSFPVYSAICKDEHKYCAAWMKEPGDYCKKYESYMKIYCKKSCGKC